MKISTVSGINGDAPKLLQLFGRAIELIAIAVADAGDRMRLRPNIAVGVLPHGPGRPCLRNLRRRRPVLGDPQKTFVQNWIWWLTTKLLLDQRS